MSAYCFSHAFHSYDICQEFEKRELAELFQITCPCRRSLVVIKGCENFPSLNLYVIRMSLSTVSVLLHLDSRTLQFQNLSFDLLSKWLLNLELIPSSQRQINNGNIFRIQCIVYGHLRTLIFVVCICDICGMHCADAVFTNEQLLGQRSRDCFKKVLKDPNINLIMEQIKLQCLCSVEPKDVSGTSKIKTNLEKLLHLNGDCQ